MSCAGIAAMLLMILSQSDVLCGVVTAARICAHVKIAVSFFPVRAAIAVKQALSLNQIKSALISATGFHLTRSTVFKARGRKMKTPALQERRLIICLSNHG
jgi:hypothetical protein